jgi:hypothetical protein
LNSGSNVINNQSLLGVRLVKKAEKTAVTDYQTGHVEVNLTQLNKLTQDIQEYQVVAAHPKKKLILAQHLKSA